MIHILEILVAFIVGGIFSAMIIPKISLVAFRCRLFDPLSIRKLHTAHIPRLGGVAFFPCIVVSVSLVIVCHNLCVGYNLLTMELTTRLLTLFSSLFILYLMGMMDDLIGMCYRSKFAVQIICSFLLVASGFCLDNFYGLFGIHELPLGVGVLFTVFIIVYIMNAVNLIDGIDGLASGLSMIAFFFFGSMFIYLNWWMYALIAFAALGVLLPFFYYNVFGQINRGRKVFMGDTGSLTIGLLLAVMAIRLSMCDPVKDNLFPRAVAVAFSFLLVPMLDVARVMLHRFRNRQPLFLPDKNHIHHKFIALGMSQRQAMVSIMGISFFFVLTNVGLVHCMGITALFVLDVAVWTLMHIYITRKIKKDYRLKSPFDRIVK